MTTQAELLSLAEENRSKVPAVDAVLQALREAQITAQTALGSMKDLAKGRQYGVDFQDGFCVMHDNTDFVAAAAKAATAMTLMASSLNTLAVLLQNAGVSVSY